MWHDVEQLNGPKQQAPVRDRSAIFRRHMDPDNEQKVSYEEVEITSGPLKALFAEIDERWREPDVQTRPLIHQSPFCLFAWRWDS